MKYYRFENQYSSMSIRILSTEPRSTLMEEREGRLFYILFSFLQTKAYELHIPPSVKARWNAWSYRVHENDVELRNLASRKVFDEFEDLCVDLGDMPRRDKNVLKIISKGLLVNNSF